MAPLAPVAALRYRLVLASRWVHVLTIRDAKVDAVGEQARCPACRSVDTVAVGLGRARRCRNCQHGWLGPELSLSSGVAAGARPAGPSRNRQEAGRASLDALQKLDLANRVRSALRIYIEAALPNPHSDEGDAWTLRPLPSTGRRKHWRRLFTLNMSNMEVLFAGYDPIAGHDQGGVLVVDSDKSHVWRRSVGDRPVEPALYATAQGRATAIGFADLSDLVSLLAHPELAGAAARLNQLLRATGQAPSLQSQWHVPEFTKWVLHD